MHREKLFCIGFQKTGTSTLAAALQILNYKVSGPDFLYSEMTIPAIERGLEEKLSNFDAFQDSPWPILYRYLAKTYPGARFILTVRDSDSWLCSILSHFGGTWTPLRQAIYGVGDPSICPEIYRLKFERHNASVIEFFASQPDRLLILRTEELSDWAPLCDFLSQEIPDEEVPFSNSKQQRLVFKRSMHGRASALKHRIRQWLKI